MRGTTPENPPVNAPLVALEATQERPASIRAKAEWTAEDWGFWIVFGTIISVILLLFAAPLFIDPDEASGCVQNTTEQFQPTISG